MSKKTPLRIFTLIIAFIAILLLQLALSSPGAAAQNGASKIARPTPNSGNQDGTPAVQHAPANLVGQAVTGGDQPGEKVESPTSLEPAGWVTIMTEGFEGAWPGSGWELNDQSGDGYDRFWGADNYKSHSGSWSAWPASGGADGGAASVLLTYPDNMDTWMTYGPFDLSDASAAEFAFWLWRDIEPMIGSHYDRLFCGVSSDYTYLGGGTFEGFRWDGKQDWTQVIIDFADPSFATTYIGDNSVSVGCNFVSDPGNSYGGPFVDDITVRKFLDAPVPDFSGTPRTGTNPLTVNFSDLSTGNINSYSWDFGDGGSSSLANPSHTYTASGDYTVSLTVSGPGGSNSKTQTNYINVADPAQPPVANFSGTPFSGARPLAVSFTNLSTGDVSSYSWNFGDGGSSSLPNPSHTFTSTGKYTISLSVNGPGGSNTNTKTNYISVTDPPPPPVADFSAKPLSGVSPLAVNFSNLSTGAISSYAWNFGDGVSSSLANPSHTYTAAGGYTVTLTVSGPGGSNNKTKTNYIHVSDPNSVPVADFSATPRFGNKPLTVNFTDLSTGDVTVWSWTFGDGTDSSATNPSHTYAMPGVYDVDLEVIGPGGRDIKAETKYINVEDPTTTVDLQADYLEVTQGIQDLNNSVRLVANKQTFVRFHVSANSTGSHYANAALFLTNGSGKKYGLKTIHPINILPKPNRGAINDAFFFELPDGFREGEVTLKAVLNPDNNAVEKSFTNNSIELKVNFESVPTPTLVLYSIGYGNDIYPKQIHRTKLVDWLKRAYPLSDITVIHRTEYYGTKPSDLPNCDQVNSLLWSKKLADIANKSVIAGAHYYGMVDDAGGFMRGCSDMPDYLAAGAPAASLPSVASGPTGDHTTQTWLGWDTDGSYADFYGGHELAHSYVRYHAEFCGAQGGISFPYPGGRISPSLTGSTAIYGFDIYTEDIYTPDWTDIMTYCDNEWISDFTYEGLMTYFKTKAVLNALEGINAPMDRLSVVGTIDPATQEVDLTPLFVIPNVEDIKPAVPGEYAIVLRNAGGAELARYPFTPDEMESGPGPADAPEINLLRISELVPYINGTSRVDIEKSGALLSSITAGAATPTINVTAPNGGETLSGDPIHVSWTASDPDGDALVFNVQYSADGGQSWETVAQFLSEKEVSIDAANIAGSDQARFRVSVSDGVHTAYDDSNNNFTVPNRIPTAAIVEPENGATYVISQTVGLRANAYDVDTGTMAADQLQWSSNKDGLLGTGQQLRLIGLSLGSHTITFRADDGIGGVAEESVQITVLSEAPVQADKLLVGPTTIIFDPNGPASTTLSIANQNAQSAIGWTATTNAAWVKLDAKSGTTPDTVVVSFVDTGLAPGSYSANITFTSPNTPGQSFDVRVSVTIQDGEQALFLPVIIRK